MTKNHTHKTLFAANIILLVGFLVFAGSKSIIARQITVSVPTHPNGTLIKTANNDNVFVLDKGARRYIPSPQIFESHNQWKNVVTISDLEMASYSMGDYILFRDGTLISDKDKVYIVEHGFKRPFVSPAVFETRGYKWENVKMVNNQQILNLHPTGPVVNSLDQRTDGDLIKTANSSNVYVLENGKRRLIPSPLVFDMRYRWNDVVTISSQEIGFYPLGRTIGFPDGMLVKDDNSAYVIENSTKRPIAHAKDFDLLGYKWDNVIKPVDYQFVLGLYPDGEMVKAD